MAEAITQGQRDQTSQIFVVTNFTEDLALDCSGDADNAIADTLGTLIQELKRKGVIEATIAT